jgi:hypothetical protein
VRIAAIGRARHRRHDDVGERIAERVEAPLQEGIDEVEARDRRHLELVADAARHRQQVQVHGKEHQQQDAEPEAGHADTEERSDGREAVEDGVLLDRGQHAERDRHGDAMMSATSVSSMWPAGARR